MPPIPYDKDENEEVMENLMNRIVAQPNFGADSDPVLTKKIESISRVGAFQRMVESADLLNDLSNSSSLFNQSEFL